MPWRELQNGSAANRFQKWLLKTLRLSRSNWKVKAIFVPLLNNWLSKQKKKLEIVWEKSIYLLRKMRSQRQTKKIKRTSKVRHRHNRCKLNLPRSNNSSRRCKTNSSSIQFCTWVRDLMLTKVDELLLVMKTCCRRLTNRICLHQQLHWIPSLVESIHKCWCFISNNNSNLQQQTKAKAIISLQTLNIQQRPLPNDMAITEAEVVTEIDYI